MNQRLLILLTTLLLSPVIGLADQYECDKATYDLSTYLSYWEKERSQSKKNQADGYVKMWQADKKKFDNTYNNYMSSDASLLIGSLALFAEHLANDFKYFISKLDRTKVISSAVFCTEATLKIPTNELVSGIWSEMRSVKSIIGEMATTAYDCRDRAIAGLIPGVTEAVALEQFYLDLKRAYNLDKDHKAAVIAFNKEVESVNALIEKYLKESKYFQYMIKQHEVVNRELKRIKDDKCELDEDSFNDSDDEITNTISNKFRSHSNRRDAYISERKNQLKIDNDASYSSMMSELNRKKHKQKNNIRKTQSNSSVEQKYEYRPKPCPSGYRKVGFDTMTDQNGCLRNGDNDLNNSILGGNYIYYFK
jgi:hypothetical protein